MFDNIGNKIKTLSVVLCIIGIFSSVVIGIYLILNVDSTTTAVKEQINSNNVINGMLIIILGSLFSWISSFCLYGFGGLIERVINTDEKLKCFKTPKQIIPNDSTITVEENIFSDDTAFCPKCGADITNDSSVCHVCGETIKNN